MKQAPEVPLKKPYHPPKFIFYGNLTDLTRNARIALDSSTR
jgi:hypothetical protein